MAYTDRQLLAFSEIAYMDLEDKVEQYKREHPGTETVKLGEILSKKQRKEIEQFGIDASEYENWSISSIMDDTGFGKSGFAACIIETSSGEPKEAAVAFRGSGELEDPESLINDWVKADGGLVHTEKTSQEKIVDKFLSENRTLLSKYDNVAMTGHSLGGALADYATVRSVDYGMDSNISQCANLDGPGHSKKFIKANQDAIDKMQDKMVHYKWSRVGSQMWNISGTERYLAIDESYLKDGRYSIAGLKQHARTAPLIDKDGTLINSTSYRTYCENLDLGKYSRLIDGALDVSNSVLPIGDVLQPLLLDGLMIISVNILAVAKGFVFGKELIESGYNTIVNGYNAVVNWGADRIDDIVQGWNSLWNSVFGSSDSQTPEQQVANRAAEEAAANISFTINPVTFVDLANAMKDMELDLADASQVCRELKNVVVLHGFNIQELKSGVPNIYGSNTIRSLNRQLKEMYQKISAIQDALGECEGMIEEALQTEGGCVDYLYLTGNEFLELEAEAKSRVAGWTM